MDSLFNGCSSLKSINLTNFDTNRLTNMASMFSGCRSLDAIDLSGFNTYNVYNMTRLFYGCDSLKYLNLSNMNMINCNSYDDIFSDISNIKYIDLRNFQNDKIISSTFNKASFDKLYVCQDEDGTTIENAQECCNYDFSKDVCPSTGTYHKNPSSSGISIGVIVGIVIGVIVLISGIIVAVFLIRRKMKRSEAAKQTGNKSNDNISTTDMPIGNSQISQLTVQDGYEYEPKVKSINPKVQIVLETTSQNKIKIIIDSDKPMNELIQFYFQIIHQPTLYGDSSIRFLMNANLIMHDSKALIKNYINKKSDFNVIVVDDLDDKINPILSN